MQQYAGCVAGPYREEEARLPPSQPCFRIDLRPAVRAGRPEADSMGVRTFGYGSSAGGRESTITEPARSTTRTTRALRRSSCRTSVSRQALMCMHAAPRRARPRHPHGGRRHAGAAEEPLCAGRHRQCVVRRHHLRQWLSGESAARAPTRWSAAPVTTCSPAGRAMTGSKGAMAMTSNSSRDARAEPIAGCRPRHRSSTGY